MTEWHPPEIEWTWSDWARMGRLEDAAVTPAGRPLVEWAITVVADFYTDEWLRRQFRQRTVPVMTLAMWPLNSPWATTDLVERAARIALLDEDVRKQLTDGPNGIRRSNSVEEFDHLDAVLETSGFALRDGWTVEVEVATPSGRKPDLRISRHSMRYTIEVTLLGTDREWRKMDRQHDMLGSVLHSLERRHDVELTLSVERNLTDDEVASFPAHLEEIAAQCAEDGRAASFKLDYAHATAYPPGERPDGTLQEGPSLGNDLWQRVAGRLQEKASQTEGAGHAWIRIDEGSGLLVFTPAYHWSITEQLAALESNVKLALAGYEHVRGVIITTGAGRDPNVQSPELGQQNPLSGAVAQERRLPAGRRRRSFVIPFSSGPGLILPDHVRLDPARWFRDEYGWIDWALSALGKPALTPFLVGEPRRKLSAW